MSFGQNVHEKAGDNKSLDEYERNDNTNNKTDADDAVGLDSEDVFKREFNKSIRHKKSTNNAPKSNRSSSLGLIHESRLIKLTENLLLKPNTFFLSPTDVVASPTDVTDLIDSLEYGT